MYFRLVKELTEKDGITETLKAENQMLWVQRMNAVQETATEIVNNVLIYAQQTHGGGEQSLPPLFLLTLSIICNFDL